MTAPPATRCGSCGGEIESCGFCDEPDCARPRCNRCVALELKERIQPVHPHGG